MQIEYNNQNHSKSQPQLQQQSSQDSWDPQIQSSNKQKQRSFFHKIHIQYDDKIIEQFLDKQCQKPILNKDIFPYQDQQQQQQETHLGQNIQQGLKQQKQQKSQKKNKIDNDNEALYNPIQDEENEGWMKKKIKNHRNQQKQQRPLTCPQCFTQICYKYYKNIQNSHNFYDQTNFASTDSINNSILLGDKRVYSAHNVENVKIHEHKVIRNRFTSENMQKKFMKNIQIQEQQKNQMLKCYEQDLKQRYDEINVKILISCEECGLELGFWDVNKQNYVLFNVI